MTTATDAFFLPGVSFTVDGETLPARECCWAMFASCGCVSGMHMITEDTVTEAAAWKQMSGNAQMVKRDRARGFTIRMCKHRDLPFDDCTHTPKWGYMPTPIPPEHSWATTRDGRAQHLVPLTPVEKDDATDSDREWVEDPEVKWWLQKVTSMCGKKTESTRLWTRKWYHLDGKVECTRCVELAEKQALALGFGGAS